MRIINVKEHQIMTEMEDLVSDALEPCDDEWNGVSPPYIMQMLVNIIELVKDNHQQCKTEWYDQIDERIAWLPTGNTDAINMHIEQLQTMWKLMDLMKDM
jgi:hypothetical protein